jgi:hypothetical protein
MTSDQKRRAAAKPDQEYRLLVLPDYPLYIGIKAVHSQQIWLRVCSRIIKAAANRPHATAYASIHQ